jgi:hypothetical protein
MWLSRVRPGQNGRQPLDYMPLDYLRSRRSSDTAPFMSPSRGGHCTLDHRPVPQPGAGHHD